MHQHYVGIMHTSICNVDTRLGYSLVFLFSCSLKMGRHSSDTEDENRSRRKKKHRRRSSSSSSSGSRTYSRKKSGRKSRSRSRDLQSRSHSYEKRCICSNLQSAAVVYKLGSFVLRVVSFRLEFYNKVCSESWKIWQYFSLTFKEKNPKTTTTKPKPPSPPLRIHNQCVCRSKGNFLIKTKPNQLK